MKRDITLTANEVGTVLVGLELLEQAKAQRAQEALDELKQLERVDHPNASIARKKATDQSELRGQVQALIDRFSNLEEEA